MCVKSAHGTLHCTAESEGYEQVGEVGSGETARHKYREGIQQIPARQGSKDDSTGNNVPVMFSQPAKRSVLAHSTNLKTFRSTRTHGESSGKKTTKEVSNSQRSYKVWKVPVQFDHNGPTTLSIHVLLLGLLVHLRTVCTT